MLLAQSIQGMLSIAMGRAYVAELKASVQMRSLRPVGFDKHSFRDITGAAVIMASRLLQAAHLGSDLAWQIGHSTGKEQLLHSRSLVYVHNGWQTGPGKKDCPDKVSQLNVTGSLAAGKEL